MSTILNSNAMLRTKIEEIAEVAGYLWEKGWAERNGGNISVNVSELMPEGAEMLPSLLQVKMPRTFKALAGNYFYVTGTGKRMRYVSSAPMNNGSIIRVTAEGNAYDVVADHAITPTSELPSHLAMHNYLLERGDANKVVLHTHPTDIIGMTHCENFLNSELLTHTLWSMIPECRIIVPKGIGIVPYEIPGSLELADATIKQLEQRDVVFWEKHGILAVGEDLIECFDAIDTLSKSAQIYLFARGCGFIPQGMTKQQLDGLVPAFNLPS